MAVNPKYSHVGLTPEHFFVSAMPAAAAGDTQPASTTAFAQLAANDTVDIVSGDAADVSINVTVYGFDSNGLYTTEVITTDASDGTTPVTSSTTFSLINYIHLHSVAAGTITLSRTTGSTTIVTVAAGVLTSKTAHWFAKHRLGDADMILHEWGAKLNTAAANATLELRWYPLATDSRSMDTSGYVMIDRFITIEADMQTQYRKPFVNGYRVAKGGYVAITCTTGKADVWLEGEVGGTI